MIGQIQDRRRLSPSSTSWLPINACATTRSSALYLGKAEAPRLIIRQVSARYETRDLSRSLCAQTSMLCGRKSCEVRLVPDFLPRCIVLEQGQSERHSLPMVVALRALQAVPTSLRHVLVLSIHYLGRRWHSIVIIRGSNVALVGFRHGGH